jgi:hypothetical protein
MPRVAYGQRQEPAPPAPLPGDPIEQAEVYRAACQLGIAVLKDALDHDRGWFQRERGALAFWCDLIGLSPDAVLEALARRKAG